MDITCHDASVLNPLLGALPADVVALAANQGPWGAAAEDALMSTLRYADGTLVQTHDAFTIAYSPTGLQVLGSDGSIESPAAMVQDPVGTILLRDSSGEREIEPEDRRDLYEINVAAFAAAVNGEGTPTATGLDGLRAVQVALAVREAAEIRATRVDRNLSHDASEACRMVKDVAADRSTDRRATRASNGSAAADAGWPMDGR